MKESELPIGTRFAGRFVIDRCLGTGGMGEVYRARHEVLQRPLAIKVIRRDLLADETVGERFRREARAASQIDHPNVVAILDFGYAPDGRAYLAMEHVEGRTLDEVLHAEAPFAVPRALHLLAQIAAGMEAAHARGVVHRDLKPRNVMLWVDDGGIERAKLLDFGLAKTIGPGGTVGLTATGQVYGTPEYLAPERCLADISDHRADIYSFGILAFEVLVGRPPFAGRTVELLRAHVERQPPPPSRAANRRDVPRELDELVLRCLAKRVQDRFPDMAELRAALARAGAESGLRGASRAPVSREPTHPALPLSAFPAPEANDTVPMRAVIAPRSVDGSVRTRALAELAYALRDQQIGSPEITYRLSLMIEAAERRLETAARIALLVEEAALLDQDGRREAMLSLLLGQIDHEVAALDAALADAVQRTTPRGDRGAPWTKGALLERRAAEVADRARQIADQRAARRQRVEAELAASRETLEALRRREADEATTLAALLASARAAIVAPAVADALEPLFARAGIPRITSTVTPSR